MAYRSGDNRQQLVLFPKSLDQYVGPDHPVRAYDTFVDALDFAELGIGLNSRKLGNSQYDPRLMLKLLLYGYSYGVKSSRKLERETHNNLSFVWLMKNLKPDHKTIAEFRRKNKKAITRALKLCARLCFKLKLIDGNILFVDSTKIRANAGKAHDHNLKWYQDKLKHVDRKIKKLLNECDRIDQSEAHKGSLVQMPKELTKAENLRASIETAMQELTRRGPKTKDGKARRVNRIDSQSACMRSRQGTHPSYAVHNVVDDKNALIVHSDAVYDSNDSAQFEPQISAAEDAVQSKCKIACADAGYADIEQLHQVETDKRKVLVPSQAKVSRKAPKPFAKHAFDYDKEQNCYICPKGHRLVFRRYQNDKETKQLYRIEKPALCRNCEHFGTCTRSKQGRTVTRHIYEPLRQTIDQRLEQPDLREIYIRRKARVEHPFGYIKKALGFGQFSMRGRRAAQAEASIVATCFNLSRMITLLGGVQGFITRVQAV